LVPQCLKLGSAPALKGDSKKEDLDLGNRFEDFG